MNSRVALRLRNAFTLIELSGRDRNHRYIGRGRRLNLRIPRNSFSSRRDSSRLSDLATLTSAINLYNTDQAGASGYSLGSPNVTYLSIPRSYGNDDCGHRLLGYRIPFGRDVPLRRKLPPMRSVNGTGWIPINLSAISSGSPLGSLPVDPVNTTSSNFYYTYQTDGTSFKIRAVPESQKYLAQAGTNPNLFTVGSKLALGGGTE